MSAKNVKLTFLGVASVGKTSLLSRITQNTFDNKVGSTIGAAFSSKVIDYEGVSYKFSFWDTAGSEQYSALIPMYYRDANIALIVTDLTDEKSFEGAITYIKDVRESHASDKKCVIVLIGNKCDVPNSERVKSTEEFIDFARAQIADIFMETSAKTGKNVDVLFERICEAASKLEDIPVQADTGIKAGSGKSDKCC